METGKLPPYLFKRFLEYLETASGDVDVPPLYGVDAGAFKIGDGYLVVSQDPITFTASDIIWYAVCVNANDVAVMGAVPKYFLATLLLPQNIDETEVEMLFKKLADVCRSFNVKLIGGHTEITYGIDRVIVNGTMLGFAKKIVTSKDAKTGDLVIMTKGIPIEAISIVAREKEEVLLSYLPSGEIARLKNFNYNPGISVVKEALVLKDYVNSMHDITEGGIMGALYELSEASGVKIRVYKNKIRVYPEADILGYFDIDPYFAIGSGSLIATVSRDRIDDLRERCLKEKIDFVVIGEVEEGRGVYVIEDKKSYFLEWDGRDTITKLFE